MTNQTQTEIKKIMGHSDLNDAQIGYMQRIVTVGKILERLTLDLKNDSDVDAVWLERGDMNLRDGISQLKRSVGKPETY